MSEAGVAAFLSSFAEGFRPDPVYLVSEWADTFRELEPGTSPHPGRWRTDRTPYMREIMDSLSIQNPATRVVLMKGSRTGGTEAGTNWGGYVMHLGLGPFLAVSPRVEDARNGSKERWAPMIRSTPVLRDRVAENKTKDGENTILFKNFPGGMLALTGANSAAGLRARTFRFLMLDEVDPYPADVDGEGDPIDLARVRIRNYGLHAKEFIVSSPTIKGASRIETEYLITDQRRYFIPCPCCGHFDYLTWDGKDWLGSNHGLHHRIVFDEHQPDTARMQCSGCSADVDERWKPQMLAHGEWRPTAVGIPNVLGYHISGLYSPYEWYRWSKAAADFLKTKKERLRFKVWINTVLGETWEERGDTKAEAQDILKPVSEGGRVETYRAQVPAGVGILSASIDVQGTWLECVVKGYGAGEESWLIDWTQFRGASGGKDVSTELNAPWSELDSYLRQPFTTESGRKVYIEVVTIDSNYRAEKVYQFVAARAHRKLPGGFEQRMFAVRGGNVTGVPLVGRSTRNNPYRAELFTLCTDTGKEIVASRLLIGKPAPGYMHLPDWIDTEYVSQLTSARRIWKTTARGRVGEWRKADSDRDEALDLEVYALSGLYILGTVVIRNLAARAAAFAKPVEPSPATPAPKAPQPIRPLTGVRRGGWMSRVKR